MSATRDPLLVTAKVVTIVARIGLVVGIVGLSIAAAIVITGGAGFDGHVKIVPSEAGLEEVRGGALLTIVIAGAALALMYDFASKLAEVIDTVGTGDPFTLDNAARLTRMAWLAIGVQVLGIPASLLSIWVRSHVDKGMFVIDSDLSLTGFGLALVLFILARVFRKGAEMREDLEGTV